MRLGVSDACRLPDVLRTDCDIGGVPSKLWFGVATELTDAAGEDLPDNAPALVSVGACCEIALDGRPIGGGSFRLAGGVTGL